MRYSSMISWIGDRYIKLPILLIVILLAPSLPGARYVLRHAKDRECSSSALVVA